ncbi:MAG: nucleoside triphosphate pyrophosphohydrolase [Actinobacteria bacterium]|nr:nucleoside triphosphate pyrophosphohydrolase [Actinomycetota bacterium]NBO79772.1 nucleoside triphosphate pyrophosphohydrolase [Actinomycetota bacterium]NBT20794.1 nucleoside triphosphate pyrophosphohydrolase [Actinomycetota bacterium]NCY08806.1 nucleoside triphosphate pyrophosphohydrolase [Actinomycetota bacterium]NDC46147.1 nucleoside triphosphate pyrophosphohydrolase [Actinomycetota bacterium]
MAAGTLSLAQSSSPDASMTRPIITVVGLGPGPAGLVTHETMQAIAHSTRRFVRTTRHPSAAVVGDARSFDDEYERHDTFAAVYEAIAHELLNTALTSGEVLYAVPGSPSVLEESVRYLRNDQRVELRVLHAVSFLDLAWQRLGIDPVNEGVRLVDAHQFAQAAANERGPFLVAQCHADWVLSDLKLTYDDARGDEPVVVLHHLGLDDEQVVHTVWQNLDRLEREHGLTPDHLTSIYIPQLAAPVAGELARLHQLARTLREQCPWDREQTHASLVRYLVEETYEVVDALNALDTDDPTTDEALVEELGDLLYQIEFHATIAEQQGRFSLADVARTTHDKLVRRHPHVFGAAKAADADAVVQTWDAIKQAERAQKGAAKVGATPNSFAGVSRAAPSLSLAQKLQKRAAEVGFDWPNADGALAKIDEELDELQRARDVGDPEVVRMELGDLLFSVVNVARKLGVDAETALRSAADKFIARFERVQLLATQRGIDVARSDLAQLDALWNDAKRDLDA